MILEADSQETIFLASRRPLATEIVVNPSVPECTCHWLCASFIYVSPLSGKGIYIHFSPGPKKIPSKLGKEGID